MSAANCTDCSGIKARLGAVEDKYNTLREDWKSGKDHQSKLNSDLFKLHREVLERLGKVQLKMVSVATVSALSGSFLYKFFEFLIKALSKG